MGLHWLIPHASAASDAGAAALATLQWPNLSQLLARLSATDRSEGDEYTLSMPHERVLARLHGWQGEDGRWPFAAWAAQQDGCLSDRPDDLADGWGLITPCHWHVGSDSVSLIDPAALALGADESRALLDALRPSFEAEGWQLQWGAPLRWYARHAVLAELKTASLERAIGRNLDLWLRGKDPDARRLRRLQVEAQMLWHEHPVNETREARGALAVNSFWLSGCGRPQPSQQPAELQIDTSLPATMLAGDWAGWCEAWRALDAGAIAALLARAQRGEAVTLTLCGERHAQTYELRPRGWLTGLRSRWQPPAVGALLAAL
ncbi:MAG: hypothetical protein AB3X44_05120 [Leptothrix sp. (in: b-proteobacteria)]